MANCFDEHGDILVNTDNGILRIKADGSARALERFDPKKHFFTQVLPAGFFENAECPMFIKTAHEILSSKRDFEPILSFAAYVLIPDCRFVKILILKGDGSNGKSVIGLLFEAVLTQEIDQNQKLITYLDLHEIADSKKYAVEDFRNAMVNMTSDLTNKPIEDMGTLKAISNGEPTSARKPGQNWKTATGPVKMVVRTNNMIHVMGGTLADYRRFLFILFSKHFPESSDR
jgi:putative DNA primase/helicase